MKRIISFCNFKGGVSKSTGCYNLAGCVAYRGKPVVILDTDPLQVLTKARANCKKDIPLQVIADKSFNIEHEVFSRDGYIFIDTPPSMDLPIKKALAISELVVIPIKPSPVDLRAAMAIFEMAKEAQQKVNPSLEVAVVINQVRPGTNISRAMVEIGKKEKFPICRSMISDSVTLIEALAAGEPMVYYRFNHVTVSQYFELAKELKIL